MCVLYGDPLESVVHEAYITPGQVEGKRGKV
jgi:hypothetical protein